MITINLKSDKPAKAYLKDFTRYKFKTVPDFIFELFSKNHIEPREAEDFVYTLIQNMGYKTIQEIPADELQVIENTFYKLLEQEEAKLDNEKIAYIVLAGINNRNLILLIDNQPIADTQSEIHLNHDSVVTFLDKNRIQDITFKSI